MSAARPDKRKKKKYYMSAKKPKTGSLEAGVKGFLITCNNESQCIKESYNLLNEFADNLYGSELEISMADGASKGIDIEDELAKEIENIKSKKRRFQQMRTMVKGILFINAAIPDPTHLATSIFENVLETGKRRARFICKFQPIVTTCKATQSDIRKHLDEYLEEFTKDPANVQLSHKVSSNIRHNTNMTTSHILWYVRESVEKYAPKWTVSLGDPQLVISVYVLKTICCFGFLKNYATYKKYNLSELATSCVGNPKADSERLLKELDSSPNPAEENKSDSDNPTSVDNSQEFRDSESHSEAENASEVDLKLNNSHSSCEKSCTELNL